LTASEEGLICMELVMFRLYGILCVWSLSCPYVIKCYSLVWYPSDWVSASSFFFLFLLFLLFFIFFLFLLVLLSLSLLSLQLSLLITQG
jgi:hypothetical protein